jgi:hypothetical protein
MNHRGIICMWQNAKADPLIEYPRFISEKDQERDCESDEHYRVRLES